MSDERLVAAGGAFYRNRKPPERRAMPEAKTAPAVADERPDTHAKALRINLDQRRYGTFAEIGAGQEVVRWFFRVGGAAGTLAKSISAYDMAVSDAIYGKRERYVCRERLQSMLDHEYELNLERLERQPRRHHARSSPSPTRSSARNYKGTNECHGWMGVKFQSRPARPGQPDHHPRPHARQPRPRCSRRRSASSA